MKRSWKFLIWYTTNGPYCFWNALIKSLLNKSFLVKYTFLTTNGSLARPEIMKKVIDAGLDSIRFSVNAADREMYKAKAEYYQNTGTDRRKN